MGLFMIPVFATVAEASARRDVDSAAFAFVAGTIFVFLLVALGLS